jgi:hypothetical protein
MLMRICKTCTNKIDTSQPNCVYPNAFYKTSPRVWRRDTMLGLLLHRNMCTGRGVDIVVVRVEVGLG